MSRNFLRRIWAGLRHAGHMFCFSLLFENLFLMIPVRPIISKIVEIYRTDIRQIIGVGRTLAVDDKSDFFDLSSYVAMATTFCWFYPQNWFSSCQWLVAQPGGLTLGFALHLVFSFGLLLPVIYWWIKLLIISPANSGHKRTCQATSQTQSVIKLRFPFTTNYLQVSGCRWRHRKQPTPGSDWPIRRGCSWPSCRGKAVCNR